MGKFSKYLLTLMNETNITQKQVADFLGCRQSQVSNWINEKSLPNYLLLQKIKLKFDVDMNDLFE